MDKSDLLAGDSSILVGCSTKLKQITIRCRDSDSVTLSRISSDEKCGLNGLFQKLRAQVGAKLVLTALGKVKCGKARLVILSSKKKVIASAELDSDFRCVTLEYAISKDACYWAGVDVRGRVELHVLSVESSPLCVPHPLTIVQTNDDGVASIGLVILRQALLAAGNRVIVFAPSGDVSGSGTAVDVAVVATTQISPDIFAVSLATVTPGEPASAVTSLAQYPALFPDLRPDLVISGINLGVNTGTADMLTSGTIGAAVLALAADVVGGDVPSIAISSAGTSEARLQQVAEFTVRLIEALQCSSFSRHNGGRLLPRFLGLNINYPDLEPSRIRGVRLARQGLFSVNDQAETIRFAYLPIQFVPPATTLTIPALVPTPDAVDFPDSDSVLLSRGFITITPISPFLDILACSVGHLADALARLGATGTFLPQSQFGGVSETLKPGHFSTHTSLGVLLEKNSDQLKVES